MFKRTLLFIATNILVITTISVVTSLLGLQPTLNSYGLSYLHVAIFCAIWGSVGAFIALLSSKVTAKTGMGVQIIDPNTASGGEKTLLDIVYGLAKKVGLSKMPEVGIYDSPEVNAFATGPSQSNSLVAVSSGLLASMNKDEIEAVLGHEISHVTNGDMVTMTLILGVVNSFSLFFSQIIAYLFSFGASRNQQDPNANPAAAYGTYRFLHMVLGVIFTFFASLLVAAFSRAREYRADKGGAILSGKEKMIEALKRLKIATENQTVIDPRVPSLAMLKIAGPGWRELFASHPSLEKRIKRLQEMKIS